MRLYLDEHVPRAVAEGLRLRGVEILTVQEDGMTGSSDPIILDRATALKCLAFSQDNDFLAEASRRQSLGLGFSGVVYCHQLRLTIGQQISELYLLATCGQPSDFENRVTYLPI